MPYNWNVGWGRIIANALAQKQRTGKVLIVCAATNTPHFQNLNEIYDETGGQAMVETTLQAAIDQAGDGDGDTIFIAPNHTETVTSAGELDTGTDTAGLTIIGLGDADERPLINFTTAATADWDFGSNGTTVENIRFDFTGVDALAAPLDVNDTGVTFRDCEFITGDSAGQAIVGITCDSDYFTLDNCYAHGSRDAGSTTFLQITGGGTNHLIKDSEIDGYWKLSTGGISFTSVAAGFRLLNTAVRNRTAASTGAVDMIISSSAIVAGCSFGILSGSTPILIDESSTTIGGGTVLVSGNYYNASTAITAGTLL
jgi:hypothetical protein